MIPMLLVMLYAAGALGKTCSKIVPGLNRQQRGVDVTKLDLMPVDPLSAEDGYKYPVISYTCDEGKQQTIGGITYEIPDQVWIVSEMNTGSLANTAVVMKSSKEVRKYMSSNAGGGLSLFNLGFSASKTFSGAQMSLAKHDKTVETVSAYFGGRRVDLHLEDFLDLGRAPQVLLGRLPTNYSDNPEGYESFIRRFGTHYIAEGSYGGLILMYMETNGEYTESHDEQTVTVQVSASFMSFLSAKGGSTTTQINVDTSFTEKTTRIVRYYGGTANLLASGGMTAWQPSISAHPWLFSTSLIPITDLVRDNSRKAALEVAVKDYILRSYLTVELPRIIDTLPAVARAQTRATTLLSSISTMANKRPLVETEVNALGQEVEREYKAIFLDFYRSEDGFRQVNEFDQAFSFECPAGKTITRIESYHNSVYEDRRWSFGCSYVPDMGVLTNCAWTDYVNNFDEQFTFSCPNHGVLKGWSSYHDSRYEDRRHKFNCCVVEGATTQSCVFTDYVNNFDYPVVYRVAYSSEVITGVSSYHDSRTEDRRFKFQKCLLHFY